MYMYFFFFFQTATLTVTVSVTRISQSYWGVFLSQCRCDWCFLLLRWRKPNISSCWGRNWSPPCWRARSPFSPSSPRTLVSPLQWPRQTRGPPSALRWPPTGRGSSLPRSAATLRSTDILTIFEMWIFYSWQSSLFGIMQTVLHLFIFCQCLRLLTHSFNREYSHVCVSASESKVDFKCHKALIAVCRSVLNIWTCRGVCVCFRSLRCLSRCRETPPPYLLSTQSHLPQHALL